MHSAEFDEFAARMRESWDESPDEYTRACETVHASPLLCMRWRPRPGAQDGTEQLLLELHRTEADALCASRNRLELTQHMHMAVILEADGSGGRAVAAHGRA